MIIPGKPRSLTPPIGVIDSLASGLETVATHLPLLLLPLLLDVALWLGPRVSFRPLLAWLGDFVASDSSPVSSLVVALVIMLVFPIFSRPGIMDFLFPTVSNPGILEPVRLALAQANVKGYEAAADSLKSVAQSAPDQYLGVSVMPSVVAGRGAGLLPFGYVPPVWQIQTPGEALVWRLLLFLAGLALLVMYLALIAQRIKGGDGNLEWVIRRVPVVLAQIVIVLAFLLALAVAAIFMLFSILSVIVILGSMVGGEYAAAILSAMIISLVMLTVTWAALLTVFTVHGMFLNERSLLAAMWDSFRVVQWNMSSTLGLFLVLLIVVLATHYIRQWLEPGSVLIPVGMVINAFISTGLLAATFVFFKDRYRYWRELREQLLAELERRRVQQIVK